jgi:hypothetical protein
MNLLTCATFNYLDKLTLLLASARSSNPDLPIHVHTIGWPKAYEAALVASYPNVRCHPHAGQARIDTEIAVDPFNRSGSVLRMKIDILQRTHASLPEPVLWVDADTLLLEPIAPLITRVTDNGDWGVTYRPGQRPHAKFAVAVMYFTRTPAACALLQEYATAVHKTPGAQRPGQSQPWFHDQVALWDIFNRLPSKLVPLRADEHSIDGTVDAMFVSRRHKVLEPPAMRDVLDTRGIPVSEVTL